MKQNIELSIEQLIENEIDPSEKRKKVDLDYGKIIVYLSKQEKQYQTFVQILGNLTEIFGSGNECHEVTLRSNLSKLVKRKAKFEIGTGSKKRTVTLSQAKVKLLNKKNRYRKQSVYFIKTIE